MADSVRVVYRKSKAKCIPFGPVRMGFLIGKIFFDAISCHGKKKKKARPSHLSVRVPLTEEQAFSEGMELEMERYRPQMWLLVAHHRL